MPKPLKWQSCALHHLAKPQYRLCGTLTEATVFPAELVSLPVIAVLAITNYVDISNAAAARPALPSCSYLMPALEPCATLALHQ